MTTVRVETIGLLEEGWLDRKGETALFHDGQIIAHVEVHERVYEMEIPDHVRGTVTLRSSLPMAGEVEFDVDGPGEVNVLLYLNHTIRNY